jgi:cyclic pyranopterin phosphate synthase
MPIGNPTLKSNEHILASEVEARLRDLGDLIPLEAGENDGPAQRFKLKGALGEIGFIRPISRHFCDKCNRLRLTANGHLRPCLLSDYQVDLKGPLRSGCSEEELAALFLKAVRHKHERHRLAINPSGEVVDPMSSIGG